MKLPFFTPNILIALLLAASPLLGGEKAMDLFASGDFSQWTQVNGEPVAKGWKINNGVVVCQGLHATDIITREKFKDFELTFDWKVEKGANSGVKYRTKGSLGLEYQILDDANHSDSEKQNHRSASLYDLVAAPDDKPINPVGKWNSSKIVVSDDLVEHWLNGTKLLEVKIGSELWKERFAKSKYSKNEGFGTWAGPILLQDHGDRVWFRNVKIKRL